MHLLHRQIRLLTTLLNNIAAGWLFLLSILIFADVTGRGLFDAPVIGIEEIVANSIVAILFCQIPLAVCDKSMIRATLVYDLFGGLGQKSIDSIVYIIGFLLFIAIAVGAFPDMVIGWQIGEKEGTGALEVPVYPTRTIIVVMSIITALIYLFLLAQTWLGDGSDD